MAVMLLEAIAGIGARSATRLRNMGIADTHDLFEAARTRAGRANVSELTTIPATSLLRWVDVIELCRVDGIDPEGAELLAASGVSSLPELRNRKAADLAQRCAEVNARLEIVRFTPSRQSLQSWIERAAKLTPRVER